LLEDKFESIIKNKSIAFDKIYKERNINKIEDEIISIPID
jgi:hypothetical protein